MKYLVTATRPNGVMRMGWDDEIDQLSCAHLYASQGWSVAIEPIPPLMRELAEDAGLVFGSDLNNPYYSQE